MNKINYFIFAFLFLMSCAFVSCQKDMYDFVDTKDGISINDAQKWYEENRPQGVQLGFAKVKSKKKKLNSKPDWKHAYKVEHKDFTTVQVPLNVQGAFTFVTPENRKAYEETGDKRYVTSLTQMVVVNYKKAGKSYGFLMTIIPDKEFQEATNFKAFHSSYKKWQKGYNGLIFFHTLDGVFTNGWRIENGKVLKSITPKEGGNIDIELKAPGAQKVSADYECQDYGYEIWTQDCTDWYYYSEHTPLTYNGTTCGNWYFDGYQYAYASCDYYNDGNGGGSSGDGGSSGGGVGGGYVATKDCNGVFGGRAYLDDCGECVEGNTGKTDCTECAEINNELAAIYQEYQGGMMAVKRKVVAEVNTGPCCGAGYIQNANGECILFSSISTANTYGLNTYTFTTKKSYTHDEALNYFIQERDISSAAGDYGFTAPLAGAGLAIISDKIKNFLIKWGGKAAGMSCGVAMTYWETFFQRQESIYQGLHDKFSYSKYNGLGLYEVKTLTTMTSPTGVNHTTTQVSYYTSDGCLFTQVFY